MTSVESVILSSFLSAMELKSTCVICSTVRECPWIRRWLNYNVYHPRQLLQLSVFFRHDGSEIAEFSQSRYYYFAVFKPCHNALRQKCSNLPRGKTTRRPLGGLCHTRPQGPWLQSWLQSSVSAAVRGSGQEDEEAWGGAQGALLQGAESAAWFYGKPLWCEGVSCRM